MAELYPGYILINTRFSSSLKDVRGMRGPDCGSDRNLVQAKVQLRLQQAKCSKMHTPAKMNWACLREPETRQKFQIALSNKFLVLEPSDTTDEAEKELSKTILECTTSLCPLIKHRVQPWISDECIHLVEKQKRA